MVEVRCPICHRVERRSDDPDGREIEVVVPGGSRTAGARLPLKRAEIAVAVREDSAKSVWGDCPACGALLVGPAGVAASAPVEVSFGEASDRTTLSFDEAGVHGETGDVSSEAALAQLREAFPEEREGAQRHQLASLGFFVVVVPIFLLWLSALSFVVVFLWSIWVGGPS